MASAPARHTRRQVLFVGRDVRVVLQPAASPVVVATFNWGKYQAEGDHFYADGLMHKLGHAAVGIVSTRPHWYVCEEMPQALAVARQAMANHPLRVGYGYSMGAYGALKHSQALALDLVLAFSPQWSVDPQEAPWDERSRWAFEPAMQGMGLRSRDRAGRAYLFMDPDHWVDRRHLQCLLPVGHNVLVPMRHCGHDTMKMLTGAESMGPVLRACLNQDDALLQSLVRRLLHQNPRFGGYLCAARGLRRARAGDLAGALRWCTQAEALVEEGLPLSRLRRCLEEAGVLPDNPEPAPGA